MPDQAVLPARADHEYPMVGETVGLWRLVRGLGRGGMGEVYEAEYDYLHLLSLRYAVEQRELIRRELEPLPRAEQGRLVSQMIGSPLPADARFAIKICNARSGTPGYRRFLQEAELAQRLGDHPYIVTVHQVSGALDLTGEMARRLALDQGKYRDLAYMVMDLASCQIDPLRLTIGEAVHVVRCIATALDHAHSQGVVHRDLKPENILGTIEHPLLTDFGIAKEIDQSEGLTRTGQIIGTLDYMSPEQATDAKRVDHRSDIYSLGVVLYEFATQGQLPYSHKLDRDSCLAAIRSDRVDPKWPREHQSRFPVRLERIILKAMAHAQEHRYQAMSELITDLDRFARGEPIGWWGRVTPKRMLHFQVRRHPRLVYGSLASAIVLLLGLAALWVPRLLDPDRRQYDKQLVAIEGQVAEIAEGARMQLDRDRVQNLAALRGNLSDSKYPELRRRLADADDSLLRHRRLECFFATNPRPPERALRPQSAFEQLKLAAGVPDAFNGSLDSTGLLITDATAISLPHFGKGLIYWYAVLQLPQQPGSFEIVVQEEDHKSGTCHLARWSIRDTNLVFELQEDEKPPVVIRNEQPPTRKISIAMVLAPDYVRTWINSPKDLRTIAHGLRDDAPATVTMSLPKDTYIEKLIVSPVPPP